MADESRVAAIRRFKVPDGLDSLLEELIRAVLKQQPTDVELFIADHLLALIRMRTEAATGSSQASPTDVVKHIVEQERRTESEISKVPIVSQEDLSPVNDEEADSENAERGSLHCVEATAVRTLAASTGTVAILGTTAKYNENVDYRRSVHSEQAYVIDDGKHELTMQKFEQELITQQPRKEAQPTAIDPREANNIVTTVIIEVPPSGVHLDANNSAEVANESQDVLPVQSAATPDDDAQPIDETAKTETKTEKYLPKVVESIEKVTVKSDTMVSENITASVDKAETNPETATGSEIKVFDKTKESPVVENKETPEEKNGSSEKESSSSEVISVINESKAHVSLLQKRISFEKNRPNRLSLGQQSVESDQNTLEISSADDVVKNGSPDLSFESSLRGSLDDSLIKDIALSSQTGDQDSKEEAKEISNTSLNTMGDGSEEGGSDLEVDGHKKSETGMKRFDTISSNGESSYRPEEHNYPSVTEQPELEEYASQQNFNFDHMPEEVFESEEEHYRLQETVRESARFEVDKICEKAVENVSDMMSKEDAGHKEVEDVNNASESSVLSAIDSFIAEKGSDFDSLSFVDEQSDSRSLSTLGADESKSRLHELPSTTVSQPEDAQERLQEWERRNEIRRDVSSSSQDISGAVITQETISFDDTDKTTLDSVSEDLPKPPDLEDLPPLPENIDQFDNITEDELKAVQLPDSSESSANPTSSDESNAPRLTPETAASKIQAGMRGYLTRKQMKNLKGGDQNKVTDGETDNFDVNLSKDYIKNKRLSLDSKLVDFENIRKLPKLKSTLSECVEEESECADLEKAAVKIQSTFRNYRARKSICLGDSHRNTSTTLNTEPRNLKSRTNGIIGETTTQKSKIAETDLEPLIEEEQKRSEQAKNEMGSNRMAVKVYEDDPLKLAAIKIQSTYRGFKTRKSIQISASAATKIQAHFRGYKVRKSIKRSSSLNDLVRNNSVSSSCSNVSSQQQELLEKQVTKIQAGVRGYLVRKRHSLQNTAAAKIQINYRRYKSRKQSNPKLFEGMDVTPEKILEEQGSLFTPNFYNQDQSQTNINYVSNEERRCST